MTKDMPLILENDLPMHLGDVGDVDDLFGDGTGLPLRPLSTQFDQRMDDLRNRGCCQYEHRQFQSLQRFKTDPCTGQSPGQGRGPLHLSLQMARSLNFGTYAANPPAVNGN